MADKKAAPLPASSGGLMRFFEEDFVPFGDDGGIETAGIGEDNPFDFGALGIGHWRHLRCNERAASRGRGR